MHHINQATSSGQRGIKEQKADDVDKQMNVKKYLFMQIHIHRQWHLHVCTYILCESGDWIH